MRTPRVAEGSRTARAAVPLLVFAYLMFLRTRQISETFWLFGDQILYWKIALRPWWELPTGGGPSSVGGTTLGPVFTWVLWAIRHTVGPWTGNLPHAGGIGLSILQSAADALLLSAIWRRFHSPSLALAVTLLAATAPYDMALTVTIWNPPLAVAFVKAAIALVLFDSDNASLSSVPGHDPGSHASRGPQLWLSTAATGAAVLAVQAHSSAAFFAAPLVASFTARELLAGRWTRAFQVAGASGVTILFLEAPFLFNLLHYPGEATSPVIVVRNVSYTLAHPWALRPAAAFRALAAGCEFILLRPWSPAWFPALLVAAAAVTLWRSRRDVTVIAATVMPMVCAVVGFSFWQLPFEHYWFLTIAPSAALTLALALTAWRKAAPLLAAALAAAVIAAQPSRAADAMTFHRLPEYGPLARGSRDIRRHVSEVRRIDTEFPLPASVDRAFLFEVLGGRVAPEARFIATIARSGRVTFTAAGDRRTW